MEERLQKIINGLRDYCRKNGFKKAVVGLSGGVDSALTAKIGVEALGAKNVFGIIMPHEGVSSPESAELAEAWAKEMGIDYKIVPINDFEKPFEALHWGHEGIAEMNIKARVRANILYHWANTHEAIVLGTGNKTEETLGYFTKYGDGAVDILPIGNLYKDEVWEAAKILGLPQAIIDRTPSAELKTGHTDEDEIGMTYTEMDEILRKFENGGQPETENEKKLRARIDANAHKNQMPPVVPC